MRVSNTKTLFLGLISVSALAKGPYNTTGLMDDIAIGGFDPVSYFSAEVSRTLKPALGQPRFLVPHDGIDFYFSIEENANLFREAPHNYLPQFNGFCAYSLADNGTLLKPSGKIWGIYEDKLYLFHSHDARRKWDSNNWHQLIQQAHSNWTQFVENN